MSTKSATPRLTLAATAEIPSPVAREASVESAEPGSRLGGQATKRVPELKRSNTVEHTAGHDTRKKFLQIKVTKWLMTNRVITAATLPVSVFPGCAGIESDPARQGVREELSNQGLTGLPPWEGSSNSRERPATPHSGGGPAPTVRFARRRGTRVRTARSRNCVQKQSSPYIHKMQHTVLSVLCLNRPDWMLQVYAGGSARRKPFLAAKLFVVRTEWP